MRKHLRYIIIIAAVAAMVLSACGPSSKEPKSSGEEQEASMKEQGEGMSEIPLEESDEVPEKEEEAGGFQKFTATDLDGNEVTEELFGKADMTMLNVWATFCDPCLREMPELEGLNQEYADQGVQIVGVAFDTINRDASVYEEQVEAAKELVEKLGVTYPNLIPSKDLLNAGLDSMFGVPTTFFIDKDGNQIGDPVVGSNKKEVWKVYIDEKLAEAEES